MPGTSANFEIQISAGLGTSLQKTETRKVSRRDNYRRRNCWVLNGKRKDKALAGTRLKLLKYVEEGIVFGEGEIRENKGVRGREGG